uniref:Uncharacterized protein n=1 Tax=Picea glauca TaxID=3330 RepID=A0A117NGY7_PICGL|nr:hypothetical protein ABT39_MTgene5771 [Picea glauca]QHR90454.1 hypothetical protein Q903MT_gene4478 [Picea sitchensis]
MPISNSSAPALPVKGGQSSSTKDPGSPHSSDFLPIFLSIFLNTADGVMSRRPSDVKPSFECC